nr:reverse transcriptase domain-containing protein [Tanacetum cinerariifolium]
GFPEAGEFSTACDPQFIGGLAPWALRRDLEALHRQERIREAESGTSRTEIALLGSEARIGKIEREILHHDLSGVEETLGNMMERLKVLESGDNATLKKKLADKEMKKLAEKEVLLDLTRMERDRAEKKLSGMRDFIWRWFVRERFPNRHLMMRALSARERRQRKMVRKGAVPKPPSDDEGSEHPRKMPKKSDEDEGPSDPRGPFIGSGGVGGSGGTSGNADGTGVRGAGPTVPKLTRTKAMGIEAANNTPWSKVRKWMTEEFCPRSVIQMMEQELYNLKMKGMDIDRYTNRFHELALLCPRMVEPEAVKVEQYIREKVKVIEEVVVIIDVSTTVVRTREEGHRKRDCPKLGRNGQGGNNRRGVYQLGAVNAQEDLKVVTGTFLLNNHYATALFDSGADRSFVSTKFSTLINIKPVKIDTSYEVELADVKI